MKTITTTKINRVEDLPAEFTAEGIVAFEMVKFEINYFGNVIETTHDTKVMKDGRQIVIGGCGFIPEGYTL